MVQKTNELQPMESLACDISSSDVTFSDSNGVLLWVGTGGTLVVDLQRDEDGTERSYENVQDGYAFPFRVKKVYTSSTVSDLVAHKE